MIKVRVCAELLIVVGVIGLLPATRITAHFVPHWKMTGLFVLALLSLILTVLGLSTSDLSHECLRPCEWPAQPRTCRYDFTVEWYYSMSKACFDCPVNRTDCGRPDCIPLNGVPRPVAVVNRMFPGPSIQICAHDILEVKVTNSLKSYSEGTAIHWHGPHQFGTPYMDGTAMTSQCPIPIGASFTYRFPAETYGTHWWHAHAGMQRADGVFGALVVRQPDPREQHRKLYDRDLPEHVVLLHDWLDRVTLDKFAAHHHDNGSNKPESVLVNGKGRRAAFTDPATNETVFTEREVFRVQQGLRYRFRTISNAITNCALKVSVDGHNLTIIASDGSPVEPVEADFYIIYGGERFDFVLDANATVGNYWMRVKGLADCKFVQDLAVVRYVGAPDTDPTEDEKIDRQGVFVNPFNQEASETAIAIPQLNATEPDDGTSVAQADVIHYLGMDFYKVNNYHFHEPVNYPIEDVSRTHHLYSPQLNHLSFAFPPSPPLTQSRDIPAGEFCTPESMAAAKDCVREYCECTHTIEVKLGQVVELVLIDEGVTFDASHPMHIHGHSFRVVALEKLNTSTSVQEVMDLDKAGNITRKLSRAPLKDTVIVPDGGFTAVRFVANNPGWWLFHCHLEFHVEIGMSVLIRVGSEEDLPPKPKDFPSCGSWSPHGVEEDIATPVPCGGAVYLTPAKALLTLYLLLIIFLLN
ncbi:laccase-like isoform X2 [Acanthaster planci]|uniref:Laccase-like isoform X2 n=1 Tax=Acanthaster planci TaxID=133434 RepID=A0A8B7Y868_ACAPL|nr:laccase-like isoform X2 [Acanthaster planci]